MKTIFVVRRTQGGNEWAICNKTTGEAVATAPSRRVARQFAKDWNAKHVDRDQEAAAPAA